MYEIGTQLKRMTKESINWKNRYDKIIPNFSEFETVFLPIRHFNSDHPITPGLINNVPYNIADQPLNINYGGHVSLKPALIGGGYYLWHKGIGIVIDPGYGFVDSLHRYHRINVHHIHAVIITHDHLDHHADLETIINLRRGHKHDLKIFALDEINDVYQLSERERISNYGIKYYPLDIENEEEIFVYDNISILLLPTLHWQRVRNITKGKKLLTPSELLKMHFNTIGIQIILSDIKKRILISGDTLFPINHDEDNNWYAYQKNNDQSPYLKPKYASRLGWTLNDLSRSKSDIIKIIKNRCSDLIKCYKNLKKSDIVCLHIGSLEKGFTKLPDKKNKPIDIFNKRHDVDYCYQGFHLGLMGSVRLMEILNESNNSDQEMGFDCERGLVVLSEFGEELLGNRQNICTIFAEILKEMEHSKVKNVSVIPSELTLRLRLYHQNIDEKNTGLYCSYCGNIHDWQHACGEEGPGEIITFYAKGPDGNRTYHNCTYWKK